MLATVSAWKNSVKATVGGVGILMGPRTVKSLNSIERIQPKMMVVTFNSNPRATIISCYSPTNVSEETELVAFYDELSSVLRSIPKHNVLVIGGDMNVQIGKNGNNKCSLHNTSNRNGQHLTDFMIENRLTCLNTNYQKKGGKIMDLHTLAVREKCADVKSAFKCYRKNSTSTNALKLKKAQNELASLYLKEQTEYIQNQND